MNTISAARPSFGGQIQPRFGAHYNLLTVDDDFTVRNPIAKKFQQLGKLQGDTFNVSKAVDAEDAIHQLEASKDNPTDCFDMVITDNSMPTRGDGMKVLQHIQNMAPQYKPKYTFMYSSDADIKEEALKLGADDVYDKTKITAVKLATELMAKFFPPKAERPTSHRRAQSTPDLRSVENSPKPFALPLPNPGRAD